MPIKFKNMGHADRILKICRQVLSEHVSGPEEAILGRDRVRNAFCRGFGYHHYPGLERALMDRHNRTDRPHNKEELEIALSRAFEGALDVARERGFEAKANKTVLVRLAIDEIIDWQNRRPTNESTLVAGTASLDRKPGNLFSHAAQEQGHLEQLSPRLGRNPETLSRGPVDSDFHLEELVQAIGYRLVAYIAGLNSIKGIEQWVQSRAPRDKELRLKAM